MGAGVSAPLPLTENMLIQGTTYILGDEKALGLYEMNEIAPNGWCRYQIIHVVRDGKVSEYRQNLGKAKRFKANQIRIPSYMEHTVNELREMADEMRAEKPIDLLDLIGVKR